MAGRHSPLNREGKLTQDEIVRRDFVKIAYQRGHLNSQGTDTDRLLSYNGCFLQDVIEMAIEQIDFLDDERPDLSTPENTLAKRKLEEAWFCLEMRKIQRERAGVLGTYLPVPPAPSTTTSATTTGS